MRRYLSARQTLALVAAVYVFLIFFNPQNVKHQRNADSLLDIPDLFWGDGFRYYQLTEAIAKKSRLYIYEGVGDIDGPVSLALGRDSRVYISQSPGLSFLGVPFYIALGKPGLYLMNALLGLCVCGVIYLICRLSYDTGVSAKATLFLGLGTMTVTYSHVFYADILCALLVAAAYYLTLKNIRFGGGANLFMAGLLCGLLPLAKTSLAVSAVAFGLWILLKRGFGGLTVFLLGACLTGWVFFAYNVACFGGPLKTGFSSRLHSVGGVVRAFDMGGIESFQNNLFKTVPGLVFFLFLTQPILLLILYGLWCSPTGAFSWGPRLLLPVIPLMAHPLAANLKNQGIRQARITWVIFAVSAYISLLSLSMLSWHIVSGSPLVEMMRYRPPHI
jgi:hypothetical protein